MRRRRHGLPDPFDPAGLRWMIGQPAAVIHREVCAFLRGRDFLVQEALAEWALAGFPGWAHGEGEIPLDPLLRLARRLSITGPMVRHGWRIFPLLPFGCLAAPLRGAARPLGESLDSLQSRAVIAAFQRALLHEWWNAWPTELGLLEEYDRLRVGLGEFRRIERSMWLRLERSAGAEGTLQVGARSYRLPPRKSYAGDLRAPRRRVAAVVLAHGEGTNRKRLELRLQRARRQRPGDQAWTSYVAWLVLHPETLAELRHVLPAIRRTRRALGQALAPGRAS